MRSLNDILPLKNKLYRTALRITLNAQEAEDIVQETLIKVWRVCEEDNLINDLEAYAFITCRNLSLDYLKRLKRINARCAIQFPIPSAPLTDDDPLTHLTARESLQNIENFINTLPERQRTCWHLRDIEALPYKEIASILSITEEQVKINIFRARKALKEKFIDFPYK